MESLWLPKTKILFRDNKPLVRATAGFQLCAAVFVCSQLRLQPCSTDCSILHQVTELQNLQNLQIWFTGAQHSRHLVRANTWARRGRLSSAIYFQSNDKESCGFYGMIFEYRVMPSYHVAVISEMIIKIWAVDREFIDPNSRLGSDPTSLTHPYSLRIQQIRANQTVCYISRSHSEITRDTCDTRDNVSPVKLRHDRR